MSVSAAGGKKDKVSVADNSNFRPKWSGCNNSGAPAFTSTVDRTSFGETPKDWAWQEERVLRWATRRAKTQQRPVILFTFATAGYKAYVESWVVNLEILGVQAYVVVAEDEELFQFVEDLVPGHGIHFGFRGMEHSSEHVLYGSNEFFRTTFSKPAHFKVTPSITMVLVT